MKPLAGITLATGMKGIDLCCCNGAGMRFLVRCRGVGSMMGVDATETVVERCRAFMKFPSLEDRDGYVGLLRQNGCEVETAEDTKRFAPYIDLYIDMLQKQLTSDALRILGHDQERMEAMAAETTFMQGLAHEGKLAQSLFVARVRIRP